MAHSRVRRTASGIASPFMRSETESRVGRRRVESRVSGALLDRRHAELSERSTLARSSDRGPGYRREPYGSESTQVWPGKFSWFRAENGRKFLHLQIRSATISTGQPALSCALASPGNLRTVRPDRDGSGKTLELQRGHGANPTGQISPAERPRRAAQGMRAVERREHERIDRR